MADYIYLLETRLSPAQREALNQVRDVARSHGLTVFLVGGAVRDLTIGTSIRDLDVVVQGNALKLRKELENAGARVVGSNEPFQSLFLSFPGGVRIELGSALTVEYPKPGKAVTRPAGILDDLRRRDFTANAMAVSLNEGSYGLLMDPLNGVADIENRELRLVSNYGFIEEPSRMIRAARLGARLGWSMEERTQQRYETGKAEDYIAALGPWERSYELEEIFHEEDPLRIAHRLEAEGWGNVLFGAWASAKANETEVERLRDVAGQLNMMGIYPDTSAALFPLLTAKLGPKDTAALKEAFANPGFVEEIESLESRTKALATQFTSKAAAAPSDAWKMLFAADPQAVLSLVFGSKSGAVQQRIKQFFNDWPQARNRIPYALMQEMRITPDLPGYDDLLEKLFFAIMDAKLDTPEDAKAFLEPYSPPAPPPPPNLRRRPAKREGKAGKKAAKTGTDGKSAEDSMAATDSGAVATAEAAPNGTKSAPAKSAEKAGSGKAAVAQPNGAGPHDLPAEKGAAKPAAKSAAKSAPAKPNAGHSAPAAKPAKQTGKPQSGATKGGSTAGKSAKSAAKKPAAPGAKSGAKSGKSGSTPAKPSATHKPSPARKPVAKSAKSKAPAKRPAAPAKKAATAKKTTASKSASKSGRR